MKKIVFFTLYDNIAIGNRMLSAIAQQNNIETHLVNFKDQQTRPIFRDSKSHLSYQFYAGGIKYGTCYAASSYTSQEIQLLLELLHKINPDLICISTRSFGYSACKEIFTKVRETIKAPIISGGWGPTLLPDDFLQFSDYVCFGEGEKPLKEICIKINAGDFNFSKISNLIFYDNNKRLRKNAVTSPLTSEDLNSFPFPDYSDENKYLIDKNKIYTSNKTINKKIYNCLAGRGCPLSCTYCMSSKYAALYAEHDFKIKKYRIRNVDIVIEELKKAKSEGAIYIRISDEIFPMYKEWSEKFIELYKKHINLPFYAYIRPEFHSDELIKKLIDCGMNSTTVAIQSGSTYIRKNIYKRFLPKDKIQEFAETVKKNNLDFTYHLMNFNPFETEDHMTETLELLYRLPYSTLILFKLVSFKGTPIAKMLEEQKPVGLPDNIQKWYGYLYTMATASDPYRKLSKYIHKRKLFRNHVYILALFFIPSFIDIHIKKMIRKMRYGSSTLLPIPTKNKK